jgi:hypothetical protein
MSCWPHCEQYGPRRTAWQFRQISGGVVDFRSCAERCRLDTRTTRAVALQNESFLVGRLAQLPLTRDGATNEFCARLTPLRPASSHATNSIVPLLQPRATGRRERFDPRIVRPESPRGCVVCFGCLPVDRRPAEQGPQSCPIQSCPHR